MSKAERAAWDERFQSGDHASADPDPFLLQLNDYAVLFPQTRRALDVACGAGRNAVWLAEKGWSVTACDISVEGLRRAKALADERNVRLDLFCQDLETVALPNSPMRYAGSPLRTLGPPPALGEHTDEVLSEFCGPDAAELARLRQAGVIGG